MDEGLEGGSVPALRDTDGVPVPTPEPEWDYEGEDLSGADVTRFERCAENEREGDNDDDEAPEPESVAHEYECAPIPAPRDVEFSSPPTSSPSGRMADQQQHDPDARGRVRHTADALEDGRNDALDGPRLPQVVGGSAIPEGIQAEVENRLPPPLMRSEFGVTGSTDTT